MFCFWFLHKWKPVSVRPIKVDDDLDGSGKYFHHDTYVTFKCEKCNDLKSKRISHSYLELKDLQ